MQALEARIKERHHRQFQSFKQELLVMMSQLHPLDILESGIFQKYESSMFGPPQYSSRPTLIREENLQGIKFYIVERKSFSQDCHKVDNRLNRLEEQHKVDLAIWSNIMVNHFSLRPQTESSIGSKEETGNLSLLKENSQENTIDQIFKRAAQQILHNPKNIHKVFKQLANKIEEDHNKMLQYLNELRKQNSRLAKTNQEQSKKQLEYIVQQKQLQKRILQLEQQISGIYEDIGKREDNLSEKEMALHRECRQRLKQFENRNKENMKNNVMGQFWEKVNLESRKRKTLLEIDREKSKIDLQREALQVFTPTVRSFDIE